MRVAGRFWAFSNKSAQCLLPGDVVNNSVPWTPVEVPTSAPRLEALDVQVELAEFIGQYGHRAAAAGMLRVQGFTARLYLGYGRARHLRYQLRILPCAKY